MDQAGVKRLTRGRSIPNENPGRPHLISLLLTPLKHLAVLSVLATLAGCPSLPPAQDGELTWPQRQRILNQQTSFETTGRLSLTVPSETNQASFALNVDQQDLALQLSGPFGIGAIRLEVMDGQGRLISARHGDVALRDTEEDLAALLGYPVPLNAIRYWALGLPQPGYPASQSMTEDGRRLAALEQQGWRVEFKDYRSVLLRENDPESPIYLPRKVLLSGPDVRILMVFRDWHF